MDAEDRALADLKAKMTPEQRKDMSDLLQAELRRRMDEKKRVGNGVSRSKSSVKSSAFGSSLDNEDVGDVYRSIDGDVKSLRLKKLEAQLAEAKRQSAKYGKYSRAKKKNQARGISVLRETGEGVGLGLSLPILSSKPLKSIGLLSVIVILAGLKVVFSTGLVDASTESKLTLRPQDRGMLSMPITKDALPEIGKRDAVDSKNDNYQVKEKVTYIGPSLSRTTGNWSEAEKKILVSLDSRRVELERRKVSLDKRENELKKQSRALSERMAELRSLTSRLAEVREEKDRKYEARLEQLAGVYGSMSPKEAAPLMAKLDERISLALLQRMTGKRMGQILSMMNHESAVALTKSLTDKQTL